MLKNNSSHASGGDMPLEDRRRVEFFLKSLEAKLENLSSNALRRAIRPLLPGSVFVGKYGDMLYVAYQNHLGLPSFIFSKLQADGVPSLQSFLNFARDYLGFDDPCIFRIESKLADCPPTDLDKALSHIAREIMTNETLAYTQRQQEKGVLTNTMFGFNPVFGPNRFPLRDDFVFVLMPFQNGLTQIYQTVIKPTVENDFQMVCKRADEISSNRAIMDDIWRSICEARLIIADLTDFNPNVMYELGIAHTVGKESVLVYQRSENASEKFPFDLAHIRRIEYENTVVGGDVLRRDLRRVLEAVLRPTVTAEVAAH